MSSNCTGGQIRRGGVIPLTTCVSLSVSGVTRNGVVSTPVIFLCTPVIFLCTPVICPSSVGSAVIPILSNALSACSSNVCGGGVITTSLASSKSDSSTSPGTSARISG